MAGCLFPLTSLLSLLSVHSARGRVCVQRIISSLWVWVGSLNLVLSLRWGAAKYLVSDVLCKPISIVKVVNVQICRTSRDCSFLFVCFFRKSLNSRGCCERSKMSRSSLVLVRIHRRRSRVVKVVLICGGRGAYLVLSLVRTVRFQSGLNRKVK